MITHREESVTAKEARLKEELVVRREAEQRAETVHDTVRQTEVEVELLRSAETSTRFWKKRSSISPKMAGLCRCN